MKQIDEKFHKTFDLWRRVFGVINADNMVNIHLTALQLSFGQSQLVAFFESFAESFKIMNKFVIE